MPSVFAPFALWQTSVRSTRGATRCRTSGRFPFSALFADGSGRIGTAKGTVGRGELAALCPAEDQYSLLRQWTERHQPEPEDEAARRTLADGRSYERMLAYGTELRVLSQRIWDE
jgi:hypothetical protein